MKQQTRKVSRKIKSKNRSRIAIVVSRYHASIGNGLLEGALKALKEVGFSGKDIDVVRVPGAFEIPVAAKRCADCKKYRGIVCLGCIIEGETPHFEYICQAATMGLTRIALDTNLPVGFGLLTTKNLKQAVARSSPDNYNKGREAALTVFEMMELFTKEQGV